MIMPCKCGRVYIMDYIQDLKRYERFGGCRVCDPYERRTIVL